MQKAGWDQAQFTEASEIIIVCGDKTAYKTKPERYWANADEEIRSMLVPMIVDFYDGRDLTGRDEVMRSGALAAQNIMLSAKSLGYDTCPMIGFDPEAFAVIINLPPEHVIVMAIAIGKSIKEANPRGGQLPLDEVLITNRFS